MPRDELEKLAERVESEEPSWGLWRQVYLAINPGDRLPSSSRFNLFDSMFRVGAYRDAAAMLMPEGWEVGVKIVGKHADVHINKMAFDAKEPCRIYEASHATGPHAEARARLAAALRASAIAGRA